MRAVDTNVLVRLLTRDDEEQTVAAEAFVAPGAWISHVVLVETLWVLESVYEVDAGARAKAIEMLLNHRELTVQDPDVVERALGHFRKRPSLGFSDCLVVEAARKAGHGPLGTFDSDFAKLDVGMDPGQKVGVSLVEGGNTLSFENTGKRTTGEMTIHSGPGSPPVYFGTVSIPAGDSQVQFRSPDTTSTLSGGRIGNDDWYLAAPTVTLSAVDYSGRGIKSIEYQVDEGGWQKYTTPFSYPAEGSTVLGFRAEDNAGNLEVAKIQAVKLDTRAPTVTTYVDRSTYSRTEPFVVHFSADDPLPGSRVANMSGLLDGVGVVDGQTVDLLWSGLATHTLTVTAVDNAGWTTEKSVSFQLVVTVEGLRSEIETLRGRGEIDSDGLAQSFLAKVPRAWWSGGGRSQLSRLRALESEVRAQQGKHVTRRAADLLLVDIRALAQSLE